MIFARSNAFALIALLFSASAQARTWSDSTGKFSVEAELIAADHARAVLQNAEHQLISIDLDRLSSADQQFVQSHLKERDAKPSLEGEQTWTMVDGLKVRAKVVGYGQRDMTVVTRRGQIYVNDRRFDNLPEVYQKMVPKIVDHFEPATIESEAAFKAWAARQKGRVRRFHCNGVVLELENGDRYAVPFFFFSKDNLKVLQLGWNRWSAAEEDSAEREREDFLLEAHAQAYQQNPAAAGQISQLQLGLLATAAGVTNMWQVELYPQRGVEAQPMSVVVPARDSRQAAASALNAHPQFVVGPVRKLN